PTDTIDKLNRAVNQVLVDPDFIARSQAIGMEPRGGTPQALAAYVKAETERWVPLLQRLDLPKQGH
ncbi:tripartite tricarboxylate transporter substrate binding protein, partial [Pseudomonas sp. FW300-N1A1]